MERKSQEVLDHLMCYQSTDSLSTNETSCTFQIVLQDKDKNCIRSCDFVSLESEFMANGLIKSRKSGLCLCQASEADSVETWEMRTLRWKV